MFSVARYVSLSAAVAFFAFGLSVQPGYAQSPVAKLRPAAQSDRVLAGGGGARVALSGHLPAWVRPAALSATPVDSLSTMHLTVVLQRDAAVQKQFEALLAAQQEPGNVLYHQWLTPQQVGVLYGPTQHDVDAVVSWLKAQGLTVLSVAPSRMMIDATGAVGTVSAALGTSFNYYTLGGKPQRAANSEPMIPASLAAVVRSVDGLTDVEPVPAAHAELHGGPTGGEKPLYTTGAGAHYITPNDFTTLYDLGSVYASGNKGASIAGKPQRIAVIDRSDVVAADVSDYAAKVGLTGLSYTTVLATGKDPGYTGDGDQLESTLDLQRTLGTAPGAISDLVVAPNSAGGILAAAQYNVNTMVDPVMTISFYGCEATRTAANVASWDTVFQTGAAEGVSTFVCSGDSAAAGCAEDFSPPPSTTPVKSANYICSSSYATCVGGTQFTGDVTNASTYWNSTNGTGLSSARQYIPEGAWNEPLDTSNAYQIAGTGGGASVYITKPSWQTGTGVPADGHRDQPDISFTSSAHDAYYGCLSYSGYPCSAGYYYYLYGTSAAAPSMAGITALLNTRAGTAQGNMNPMLYRLAATVPTAFHDVTVASSGVTTCSTSVASVCNNSAPGPSSLTGGLAGYEVTAGYDQATGLGSLDVTNFLAAASPAKTTLAFTTAPTTLAVGTPATFAVTLTPASTSVAAPTGTVQFSLNGAAAGTVTLSANVASIMLTPTACGAYAVTATYSGDTYYSGSSAAATVLTVPCASFTVTPANQSLSLTSGAVTGNTDTVTLASTGGFTGAVALTCTISTSTAAFQPGCTVNPTSVTLTAGGSATGVVTITSTTATAMMRSESHDGLLFAGLAGAVALLCFRKRRGFVALTMVVAASAGAMMAAGCGGSSGGSSGGGSSPAPLRSSAGTYTVTVKGVSGTVNATGTFTVTIQ